MKTPSAVSARAKTCFERNWRMWVSERFATGSCAPSLAVNLGAPRERDIQTSSDIARAREWVALWRQVDSPGDIEWQKRSWARLGDQKLPVRIQLEGTDAIACWAGNAELWTKAVIRADEARTRLASWIEGLSADNPYGHVAPALRTCIRNWCDLDNADWERALDVLAWLLEHPGEQCFARQLPIRGVDTKWMEAHSGAIRPLYRALTEQDFSFATIDKLFQCKACDPLLQLEGCDEFGLSVRQLSKLEIRPRAVLICENLVNVVSLGKHEGVLAIHGSGFAVTELATVQWLSETPILYWGDLDSNGFAILNALRSFAPHARSVMMDSATLERHLDLCVNEPVPFSGELEHLTSDERDTLKLLFNGDPSHGIECLRLEQERVEWDWACSELERALVSAFEK